MENVQISEIDKNNLDERLEAQSLLDLIPNDVLGGEKLCINFDETIIREKGTALLARYQERIVGILLVNYIDTYRHECSGKLYSGYGHNIAIHKDYQNQGIGRLLLRAYIDFIGANRFYHEDFIVLMTYINANNIQSLTLHLRIGFQVAQLFPESGSSLPAYSQAYQMTIHKK